MDHFYFIAVETIRILPLVRQTKIRSKEKLSQHISILKVLGNISSHFQISYLVVSERAFGWVVFKVNPSLYQKSTEVIFSQIVYSRKFKNI